MTRFNQTEIVSVTDFPAEEDMSAEQKEAFLKNAESIDKELKILRSFQLDRVKYRSDQKKLRRLWFDYDEMVEREKSFHVYSWVRHYRFKRKFNKLPGKNKATITKEEDWAYQKHMDDLYCKSQIAEDKRLERQQAIMYGTIGSLFFLTMIVMTMIIINENG